jgi:hypothetical protein
MFSVLMRSTHSDLSLQRARQLGVDVHISQLKQPLRGMVAGPRGEDSSQQPELSA